MPPPTGPASPRRPTLADVAARAGVDRSVVSRVLNEDPALNVRPATRRRVQKAARELDYRPNSFARGLRMARAGAYGLVVPDLANPVYATLAHGAEAAAGERDAVLVTVTAGADPERTQRQLSLLREGRVDGLLLAGIEAVGDLGDRLRALDGRWLLVNRRVEGLDRYVVLDDERAARLAVEHLVGLGHRHVAHLAGPATTDSARRREAGYRAALSAHGLGAGAIWPAGYTSEGGVEAMTALLQAPERPTAVFVASVASAIGALAAARAAGVTVPGDLSVVTIHDVPLARYLAPPLTTVQMPIERLGRRAIELLASSAPDETVEEILSGPMELVVRESTAPPPGDR